MTVIKKFNTGTSQWEAIVVGKQGPPGLDGTGAPVFGQVAKMDAGTITIATQGVYQSTGLTAVLDGENAGISLGTSDTFAIKNTSGATRRLKVAASYDASMGGASKVLGLALAINGVVDLDTECRATTGLQGAIAKLATQWIIDLADGDEVALYVANHSSTVDIDFQRGRIVATSVAGFGPQGPTGATGPAGPGVATGGTTGDLLVKQSSTDFDTAWATRTTLAADTAFTSAFAATTATLTVASESTNLRHEGLGLPNTFFVGQGNRSHTASSLFVWPFVVTEPITVTNWVADVRSNTSASTETIRAGVYELDSELVLGDLIVEFPTLTVPTGTGLYVTALATPLNLLPGRYAIAWVVSASTFTLRTPQTAIPFMRLTQASNLPARFLYGSSPVANPLPDPVANQVTIQTDGVSWGPSVLLVWSYT
jgi:hypothetical protein